MHAEPDLLGLGGVHALYAYVDRFRDGDKLVAALRRKSFLEAVDLDQIDALRWLIATQVDTVVRRLSNLVSGP